MSADVPLPAETVVTVCGAEPHNQCPRHHVENPVDELGMTCPRCRRIRQLPPAKR